MKLCWEEEVRAEEGRRDKALNEVGWTRSKHVLTWVTQEWKEGQGGRKRGEGGKGGGCRGANQHVGEASLSMVAGAESMGRFRDA